MAISLQLTPNCEGIRYETKDLPQDGQRLIRELEDRTFSDLVDIFQRITFDFLNGEKVKQDLYELVIRYTLTHGKTPAYFSTRFYVTHDHEAHKFNHQLMQNLPAILNDYFKNK